MSHRPQFFGEIGMHIQDRTLLRLWTETYSTVMTGNAIMRPFVVGICMIAMESECLRDNDTAKMIASKELDIALGSFTPQMKVLCCLLTGFRLRTASASGSACQ